MAKSKKKVFITYCLLGRRAGTTVILGYSRDKAWIMDKAKTDGWKSDELIIEELPDILKI